MNTLFLFGEPIGILSGTPPPHAEGFLHAFEAGFNGCGLRIALGPLNFLMPTGAWLKACDKVHKFANVYVDRAIKYRKNISSLEDSQDKTNQRTLLFNVAEKTDDRTILRNQAVQAMMASTETTASLISHVIRNLASNPTICAHVRAEVLALGDAPLDFDQLPRIKSLQHVITESRPANFGSVLEAIANLMISPPPIPCLSPEQSHFFERHSPARRRRPGWHCSSVRSSRHPVRYFLLHAPS